MQNEIILQISSRIKDIRLENGITLEQLAEKAGVTKGLLSQVENNRTVPSLFVLINIIKGLDIDLNDFFSSLAKAVEDEPIVIKKGAYKSLKKEFEKGCYYNRIASFKHGDKLVDIVIYKQDKSAKRTPTSTNAHEYNYLLKGKMQYIINRKKYILEEGDSFYYDASKPHLSQCLDCDSFEMLVVYFFKS